MSENDNLETAVVEDDAILPDGWAEDADYFDPSAWGSTDAAAKEDDFFADVLDDEQGEETPAEQPNEEPTTASEFGAVQSDDADTPVAEETAPTTEPTTQTTEPVSNKLRFKARVDHEDVDAEIDESELPTLYQKAMALDRYQAKAAKDAPTMERLERMAKNNGFDTVEAMLDAQETYDRDTFVEKMVREGTPKVLAEDYYDRTYGRPAQQTASAPEQAAAAVEDKTPVQTNNPPARDFAAEVRELWTMRPDLKGTTIPSEVAKAAAEGQNLSLAFFAYEAKQAKAAAEQLRQENNTYKQNAATAAKAPVKGVTGGGATDTQPEDPFLKGFDSEW